MSRPKRPARDARITMIRSYEREVPDTSELVGQKTNGLPFEHSLITEMGKLACYSFRW